MTMRRLYALLITQAQTALTGFLPSTGGGVTYGLGWPSEKALMDGVNNGGNLHVSFFDRGMARNRTRWLSYIVNQNLTASTVTATIGSSLIASGQSATLTLGGALSVNDGIALILRKGLSSRAVTTRAGSSDTLSTQAGALAAALNSDAVLSTWASASASGGVITLRNLLASALLGITANVGNLGTVSSELHRFMREAQLVLWSKRPDDRDNAAEQIISQLIQLEANAGFQDTDSTSASYQEFARLWLQGDIIDDDEAARFIYKRHLMLNLEYPQTVAENAWAVLAPIPELDITVGAGGDNPATIKTIGT